MSTYVIKLANGILSTTFFIDYLLIYCKLYTDTVPMPTDCIPPQKPLALVVDDEISLRLTMRAALQKAGLDVIEADNGQTAVSLCLKEKPDLILLDVLMPEMDGFETCAEIRKHPEGKYVQILMVTGLNDTESIQHALDAGANDFINKPLNLVMLGNRVKYMLKAAETLQRLQKSKRRLSMTQDLVKLGGWEIDLDSRVILCSEQAASLLGLSNKHGEISYDDFFSTIQGGERDTVRKRLDEAISEKTEFSIDYHITLPDGRVSDISNSGGVVRDEAGKPKTLQGAIQDVTLLKKIGKEKLQMEVRLKQAEKMEALGTLAAGVANEFNNILTSILGFSQLIKLQVPGQDSINTNLEHIISAGKRAEDLVVQILTYTEQTKASFLPMEIASVVKETLELIKAKLPTGVELEERIKDNGYVILSDPTQISQLLINLGKNACHAMKEKGGALTVSLSAKEFAEQDLAGYPGVRPGNFVCISVRDTGHGMDEDTIKRIYNPFFTTKNIGKGTGLGLSIVHGIVQNHGGMITVTSNVGKGTQFDLFLPRVERVSSLAQEA